jgi:hypothetical protein
VRENPGVAGLLDRAIEAHGGMERFEAASEIRAHLRSGGFALASHGKGRALRDYEATIHTREPRTVFDAYPKPGSRGVYEPERVRIESDAGEPLAERHDPRSYFRGSVRRNLWWDHLDLLYFAGYALWNYACSPFLLARPGFETEEIGAGELRVSFPPDVPTHSREQTFHFDEDGLLTRLDYTAEVFGSWAKAAHLCAEHREFDGIMVPTRRRVYPRRRDGRPRPRPTLVWIDVVSVSAR